MKNCLAGVLLLSVAYALPPTQSDDDRNDDATITLTVLDRFLVGDARSFCQVRIAVIGDQEPFRAGDTIDLEVFENDFIGDDAIWSTTYNVSADEVARQNVDRVFDCSGPFGEGDGVGGNFELKAKAVVRKDACSGFCRFDRPTTGELSVNEIDDDDDAEEDDASDDGFALPFGNTEGRIARDPDWYALSFLDRSVVTFTVLHRDSVGRVEAILYDSEGAQVAVGVAGDGETVVSTTPLAPGEYNVRVQPQDGNDFNFYDVALSIVSGGGCDPGSMELRPCGSCGQERRLCQENAEWAEWGGCMGEGGCAPGDTRNLPCGNCGQVVETCDEACMWAPAVCADEGECEPGVEEEQACEGDGIQTRLCDIECVWTEFGQCREPTCSPGEERQCYSGPVGSVGVGVCAFGLESCVDGAWGPCTGETLPAEVEDCANGTDDDCDGDTDMADDDCEDVVMPPMVAIGDPCSDADDCGEGFICLRPTDAPAFREGYCTVADCGDCPPEGICGQAFGQTYCLKRCMAPAECTAQQRCADVTADTQLACIPVCVRDSDCLDPTLPICDRASRICVPAAPTPDMRVDPPIVDMGVGAGGAAGNGGAGGTGGTPEGADAGTATAQPVSGCTASDAPALGLLGLLLLPAIRRRRR